jgi:lipid-binding SYLF domain-containing protein
MYRIALLLVGFVALPLFAPARIASAQYAEERTVQAATAVFNETMGSPLNRIPRKMLSDAAGVAIVPNVIKGSFVVGARRGRGLLFVREVDGIWHAPVFVTLTGGNIGWQVGVQSSDIILVLRTRKSVEGILNGNLTIGADAAAAAGPVGRQGSIGTDGRLGAEIYSYSRSRGLFAGVSIDGSAIQIDRLATGAYYGTTPPVTVPPSAAQLTQTIASFAGTGAPTVAAPNHVATIAQQHVTTEKDVLRGQLAQLAPELYKLIDDHWKSYLALPSAVFLGGNHPEPEELGEVVSRFDVVARDPRFSQLAKRAEFQSVYGILKHYQQALTASSSQLQLPPPPASSDVILP